MFNSFLTFGEENLGVEERKGKKRNENGKISPIFSIFLRNSPIFSKILQFSPEMTAKTTENDRKRPRKTGHPKEVVE